MNNVIYRKDKHLRILKSLSVKLSEDVTFILTYMYYTDKMDKNNNQYRYEGIIVKNSDLKAKISQMESTPNSQWKWGYGVPEFFTMYYHNDTNREGATFFKARLKKSLDNFDEFLKKVNENPIKRYPLKDYVTSDGLNINITDKESLLNACGKGVSHVRDRAEKTFDVYDPNRKFRRYNSRVRQNIEKERKFLERKYG